jgi:hypothetical protein
MDVRMQTKSQIENFYQTKDPWEFQTNPEDLKRKKIIIEKSKEFCNSILKKEQYENALELGAGEGWITKDLPAKNVYGHEISEIAVSRWDKKIKMYDQSIKYDLIIAPGVLYPQYDFKSFLNLIRDKSNGIVMTISIKDWEINDLKNPIYELEFRYRQYNETLKIYNLKQQ